MGIMKIMGSLFATSGTPVGRACPGQDSRCERRSTSPFSVLERERGRIVVIPKGEEGEMKLHEMTVWHASVWHASASGMTLANVYAIPF